MVSYFIMAVAVALLAGLTGGMPTPTTPIPPQDPLDPEAETGTKADAPALRLLAEGEP
jgi:hypothetical protein